MALGGHLGLELDPRRLDEDERATLAQWIALYKDWRGVLHGGAVWLGEERDGLVWQAQGTAERAILSVFRLAPPLDRTPAPVRLPFLAGRDRVAVQLLRKAGRVRGADRALPPLLERMCAEPVRIDGDWLAGSGLPMPPLGAESAAIFLLEPC